MVSLSCHRTTSMSRRRQPQTARNSMVTRPAGFGRLRALVERSRYAAGEMNGLAASHGLARW